VTRLLVVAAAVLVAMLLLRWLRGVSRTPATVVKQMIDAGATIIDVRTPDEFRDGSYPGAVNIPLSSLRGRLPHIPKGKPVVLYCSSGGRSAWAARTMRRAGFSEVANAGGLGDMP
jgi:phage shock protein E